jgi:hypothetical protein
MELVGVLSKDSDGVQGGSALVVRVSPETPGIWRMDVLQ